MPARPATARAACRVPPDTSLVRRARKVNRLLAETYPDARCELDFDNPFQLLVVTVLSAQTTDRRVNAVRPTLFAAYPDPTAMAGAPREVLEQIIGPLGFFRAKTDVAAQAQPGARRALRRRGPRPARRPRDAARRRSQDRQRRARQRLRRPRHHRRHPLRSPGPPPRLDRGDRPRQGRARDRRALPQARLDDALRTTSSGTAVAAATRRSPRAAPARVARLCPSFGEGPTDPIEAEKLVKTQGPA